jgi:ParB family chromosome partitioning protein
MATKKPSLGRGLSALLTSALEDVTIAEEKVSEEGGILELNVKELVPGKYQPRLGIQQTELESLSDSIRSQGIIQPILVRKVAQKKYEIIAGERRWRAAQLAGLSTVPVLLKEIPDQTAMVMALIENIQREDLNAVEEAHALERLLKEFKLTHEEIAEAVGKSRTTITNLLRILSLTPEVKSLLAEGQIELGHAKVLLSLSGKEQIMAAKEVVANKLSVRQTEALLQRSTSHKKLKKRADDPDVTLLKQKISEKLGAKIDLVYNEKGKGKLIIFYNSNEELEGIIEHIQ